MCTFVHIHRENWQNIQTRKKEGERGEKVRQERSRERGEEREYVIPLYKKRGEEIIREKGSRGACKESKRTPYTVHTQISISRRTLR